YRKAFKLLVIPDYLVHFMTGSFVTDYTYGSRTSLMNLETLQWDDEILEIFGLHKSKLCELVDQGRVCGFTTSAFSALTGLAEGTPVVSAGGDQQCAALGAGVIDNGAVQITTGTGSFLLLSSDEIILDPQMQSICNVSSVPGKYVVENSILTTSSIYAWFRNNFYPECASEGDGLDKLNREASASPAGANGLILLPHFRGRGSPDWNPAAKGMFYNVGLDTTRGDFARSILEGIAAEITENLGRLEKLLSVNGGEISNITVGGGLTNFELFNHIQADFINRRLTLSCNREASALGAWVSAAVALGFHQTPYSALKEAEIGIEKHSYEPVEENATIYGNSLVLRKRLYETLSGNGIYNM
ncbi:MAG: glycerol kinase, partial [Clostridiales bacterium]|nr:glycerol kinase [Clostridiales bacterium]